MGKQYDSPVKRYPGYIIMPEYFNWAQMIAWDECVTKARTAEGTLSKMAAQADGVLLMVEEWHITGIAEKPTALPASPVRPAAELMGWIIGIINGMIMEAEAPDPFLSKD
jgi:hypothetical protein